ncbi:MAG: isochorismate synthase [Candidatus Aquiluna sp. XM-24bin5]|nr:MAG: isochorismate synthase [Candidatus Aquiluna sp. XM-24bin5]
MSLKVHIRPVAAPKPLELGGANVFLHEGKLIIGYGVAKRLSSSGKDRISQLASAWQELVEESEITDEVSIPGSGLLGLTSITFSSKSGAESVIIVPARTLVIQEGHCYEVVAGLGETMESGTQPNGPFVEGEQSSAAFRASVEKAIKEIQGGSLEKVVLARDLLLPAEADIDLAGALEKLHERYPHCWTYKVESVFGASPELLIRSEGGEVSARVLAGTAGRGTDPDVDRAIADGLSHSLKNKHEHSLAVDSLVEALEPYCSVIETDSEPFSLALPDLWHLATDVRGKLKSSTSLLDVVDALHPTAAVAGTPTDKAMQLIDKLEPFDRAGYAGPVGWLSSDGSGEIAIALRGGVIEPGAIRALAGSGIVGESDPEAELSETELKFRAVRWAFSS